MELKIFDEIIDKKVGFGRFQIRALIVLCLVDFNDGIEVILMSIVLPLLKNDWDLSLLSISILSSIFYLGMCLGGSLSNISDKYGRKPILVICSITQGIIGLFCVISQNIIQMNISRLLYGFVYGLNLPLSTTLYSEISTIKMRGKGIILINSFVGFGKLYGVITAYFVLESLNQGNWRLMILIGCLPSFFLFFGTIFFLKESPRFLMMKDKYDEMRKVFNEMISINKNENIKESIENKEIEEIKIWKVDVFENLQNTTILTLFSKKYWFLTIKLWFMWFSFEISSKGQMLILPFILGSTNKGFSDLIIAILGETPALLFSYYFVDNKFLGRKKTIIIFFFLASLFNFFLFFNWNFSLFLFLSRFVYRLLSSMLFTYNTEIYPTPLRTLGVGWGQSFGKAASCCMPFILLPIYHYNNFAPFLFLAILCFFATVFATLLKRDTTGVHLDEKELISLA